MRRRLHAILFDAKPDDRLARVVGYALFILIAVNAFANILETEDSVLRRAPHLFHGFEVVSVVIFSVEYAIRIWVCVEEPRYAGRFGRLRFAVSPMALIDLAAIAPFFITHLTSYHLDLRYLRVLRILRVFKLLRSARTRRAFAILARVVNGKRTEIGVTLVLVMMVMFLSSGLMYLLEHDDPSSPFTSIPRAMWWSIVTITTIGYGDMVPVTAAGKVLSGVVGFVGICLLALPVGILSSGFIEEIGRRNAEKARDAEDAGAPCPTCGRSRSSE